MTTFSPNHLDELVNQLRRQGVPVKSERQPAFARFPAIWRGGDGLNVVLYRDGGAYDFVDRERLSFPELCQRLAIDIETADDNTLNPPSALSQIVQDSQHQRADNQAKQVAKRIRHLWLNSLPLWAPESEILVGRALVRQRRQAKHLNQQTLPARLYLQQRGIPVELIEMRESPLQFYPEKEGGLLLIPIIDEAGERIGLQRIGLTKEGEKQPVFTDSKVPDSGPTKAMLGSSKGYCLLKPPPDQQPSLLPQHVCLVEGVETGLAVLAVTGLPTLILFSSAGIASPPVGYMQRITGLQGVIIAEDHDKAGREAAAEATSLLTQAGLTVYRVCPPEQGADWLDTLFDRGLPQCRELFVRLLDSTIES